MEWIRTADRVPEDGMRVLAAYRQGRGWSYQTLSYRLSPHMGAFWDDGEHTYIVPEYWCSIDEPERDCTHTTGL